MGCNNSTLIKKAKSYVMKEKASVDDMPDILAKLIAAKSSKNVKAALKTLMEVAPNELAAQQVEQRALLRRLGGDQGEGLGGARPEGGRGGAAAEPPVEPREGRGCAPRPAQGCLEIVTIDCQKHARSDEQFRAMFVQNCVVTDATTELRGS